MKTLSEIVQSITSPSILDELAELIRAHDKTFPQEETIYHEAVEDLKKTMSPHSVDEYIRACQTEVVANILYAAYEGYRANLVNFYSPCATDFPRMDFTDYIRDHLIGHFPPAMDAYHIREAFIKTLPEAARGAEKAISGYYTLLDVMAPSWRIMLVTSWQTSFSHGSCLVIVKTIARPPHIAANWKSTWDIFPHRNHGSSSRRNNNHGGAKWYYV